MFFAISVVEPRMRDMKHAPMNRTEGMDIRLRDKA